MNQFKLHQKTETETYYKTMNPILLQENYRFFNLIIFTNKNYFVLINSLKNISKFDINKLNSFYRR